MVPRLQLEHMFGLIREANRSGIPITVTMEAVIEAGEPVDGCVTHYDTGRRRMTVEIGK